MRILHVMDPIGGIDITKDTSFVFIREAQERGHDNHYCGIADLAVRNGTLSARAAKLTVTEVQGEHSTLGPHAWQDAESFAAVFMRKDPPFDTDFFFATHLLSLIDQTKTLVFNRPEGLREATEKLFILRFPDLITETIVSANSEELLAFGRTTGDIVIKPLDGCGGMGVFRISNGDLNTHSILESATAGGRRQVMAQRYLPESRQGDKRVIYIDGRAAGCMTRVPQDDDLRSNIHVGGNCVASEIGDREREICTRLAPELDRLGIYFAGLDVIGPYLTEVNVTSPTGVQETNRLSGTKLEAEVIDMVEAKCAGLSR